MVRRHNGHRMKIFCLWTSSLSSIFPFWAPAEYGGLGDLRPKLRDLMTNDGLSLDEASDEVLGSYYALANLRLL